MRTLHPRTAILGAALPPWRRFWTLSLALLLAFVSWQALREKPITLSVSAGDKLQHLLAFATLAVPLGLLLARRAGRHWRVLGLLLAYGVAIELAQATLPYRSAEVLDVLADAIGALLGLIVLRGLEHWAGPPPPDPR